MVDRTAGRRPARPSARRERLDVARRPTGRMWSCPNANERSLVRQALSAYDGAMVQVGLGVFSGEWHPGTGLDHGETLRESIGQVVHAEAVGLDSIWVSE